MHTILVSGAASGLGAAFASACSQRPNTQIIAIDQAFGDGFSHSPNVRTYTVDVSSEDSITTLASNLHGLSIDLVVHSAGARGLVHALETVRAGDVEACESLEVMDAATLSHTFAVNATGTFLLLRALLPNLRANLSSTNDDCARRTVPKVIVMASRMGSIACNRLDQGGSNSAAGGSYAYRASKAAVNAIVRSFAIDVPDAAFILCHLGRVKTGLVKWRGEGAISARQCVDRLLPLIDGWDSMESGRFFYQFGKVIDW